MTCPHCEAKDEEIRHLRRELGLRMADGEIGALMSRLGVSPTQARLLRVLYAAKGRTVGHGALIDELPMAWVHYSVFRERRADSPDHSA